jgi:hypothetical protein
MDRPMLAGTLTNWKYIPMFRVEEVAALLDLYPPSIL